MGINREKIYQKYNGHCAYCGQEITIKEMQIDHIQSKYLGGTDDIDNLNPSCRLCNHYKRACNPKQFKEWLLDGIIGRLRQNYIFKVAERYGMITVNEWDKKFYYEDMPKENK